MEKGEGRRAHLEGRRGKAVESGWSADLSRRVSPSLPPLGSPTPPPLLVTPPTAARWNHSPTTPPPPPPLVTSLGASRLHSAAAAPPRVCARVQQRPPAQTNHAQLAVELAHALAVVLLSGPHIDAAAGGDRAWGRAEGDRVCLLEWTLLLEQGLFLGAGLSLDHHHTGPGTERRSLGSQDGACCSPSARRRRPERLQRRRVAGKRDSRAS